jgi:hypothetical protein
MLVYQVLNLRFYAKLVCPAVTSLTKYYLATTSEYTATVENEAPTLISVSTTTEETAPIINISDDVASTTIAVSKIDRTTARESTTKYEGENKPTEANTRLTRWRR